MCSLNPQQLQLAKRKREAKMQAINTILGRMREKGDQPAIFWENNALSYRNFCEMIEEWVARLPETGVGAGSVCAVLSDYSPQTCALFFALMTRKAIIVPFTPEIEKDMPELLPIAGAQHLFRFDRDDNWQQESLPDAGQNALVETFRSRQSPGLIVFTSGSTGKPKGILHDCERVMQKFVAERNGWRTVLFLMMDHFGGFNTLLSAFTYGGAAVCLPSRSPDDVCAAIAASGADLLPTTPTFLNLLIASGVYRSHDLSSIKLITYGTEVMPDATLKKTREIFPNAKLKQTYGLSELGVLRSKSESDDSPWVKIGGDGFEVKIIDSTLWVRSQANMIGYLNAPNAIDADGWMCTGDKVQVRGEFMRILGRKSDMINVGGQKVFPLEIENVLLEAENIGEASVFAQPHPIMGQVVYAKVSLIQPEDPVMLTERLRKHCFQRLAKYKVPLRFRIAATDDLHSDRFKKIRQE